MTIDIPAEAKNLEALAPQILNKDQIAKKKFADELSTIASALEPYGASVNPLKMPYYVEQLQGQFKFDTIADTGCPRSVPEIKITSPYPKKFSVTITEADQSACRRSAAIDVP